ncbi:MAG: ABC transporter permease, partial [Paramuribaculum sp.]|nr:ABC transporter permease [Paramuribaculum sp.]
YKQGWIRDNFIPLTTLDALTTGKPSFRQLDVIATSFDDVDDSRQMVDEIKRSLASNHNFDPFDQGALWAYNNYANRIESQQAMKILETAMWIVGILTMLTGIVGISNIMFVAVKERTHEIGIRRAIGAKPRRILADIVAESVVLTLMFGYIGIVVGMAATEAVKLVPHADEMLLNPGIDLAMALEVTAVLVVAGIVAGLFPAVKATKVKPVEALRDE